MYIYINIYENRTLNLYIVIISKYYFLLYFYQINAAFLNKEASFKNILSGSVTHHALLVLWVLFLLLPSYLDGDFTPMNARGARHPDLVINTGSAAGVCDNLLILMHDEGRGFKHFLAKVFR